MDRTTNHELLAELELRRFLDESVDALSSCHDWMSLLQRLARLAQGVADWSLVDVIEEERHIVRAAVAHADPQREGLLRTLGCRPERGMPGVLRAIESARTQVVPDESDLSRAAGALGAEDVAALARLGARAFCCVPLDVGGRALGVVTVVSAHAPLDPRAVERLEQLCRRAAPLLGHARRQRELSRALRQRHDTLAIIAHDLQNPLAAIRLSLEMLLMTPPENERRRIGRAQLHLSHRATEWMSRITQELTRLSAGHPLSQPVRNPHLLSELLDDAIAILEPLASQKSLALRQELPALLQVHGDGEQLFRVLSNLLGNAIRSSTPGGVVTVRAEPDDEEVRVSVEHSGPGVAERELGALFERSGDGARLGLFIARSIVEDHGGRIWAESEGTRFHFTVPSSLRTSYGAEG